MHKKKLIVLKFLFFKARYSSIKMTVALIPRVDPLLAEVIE